MERSVLIQKYRVTFACAAAAGMLCQSVSAVSSGKIANAVKYAKAAFQPQAGGVSPALYIGASDGFGVAVDDVYALARVALKANTDGTVSVDKVAIAPAKTLLNNEKDLDNPLFFQNKAITNLALAGTYPVVTVADDATVYMISKPTDGSRVLTHNDGVTVKEALNDANKAATNAIAGIAAGLDANNKPIVFAAVSKTGVAWSDAVGTDRGIALLKPSAAFDALTPYDATDFTKTNNDNKAVKLSLLAADNIVAKTKDANFDVGAADTADMHWNSYLKRLYIGLDKVEANVDTGTVSALVMGKFDDDVAPTKLELKAVIKDFAVGAFPDEKYVIGGTSGPVNKGVGTIKQMRSMKTSTEKDYLIVNSVATAGGKTAQGICALPLLGQAYLDNKGAVEAVGTISKVTGKAATDVATFIHTPAAIDDLPMITQNAVKVVDPALLNADAVKDIFVQGDTVYYCMHDATPNTDQSGIFAATALFNTEGAIRGWTPSRRAFGSVQAVYGGGFDASLGEMYALTNETYNGLAVADVNTVRVSQWGKSGTGDALANGGKLLADLLADLFPQADGGVVSYHVFDQSTPGFSSVDPTTSMGVAVGAKKVAIIKLGEGAAGAFVPTKNFIEGTNVFVFEATAGSVLEAIAPLTCAEVSRTVEQLGVQGAGYLFVGGLGGVAVLSLTANGRGWDNRNGANQGLGSNGAVFDQAAGANFPGANWSFTKLRPTTEGIFDNTIKLMARNQRLYVTTLSGVSFFVMAANKFFGAPAVATAEVAVTGLPANTVVADMVLVGENNLVADAANNRGIIATDKGLYAVQLLDAGAVAEKITDAEVGDLALQLFALGDNAGGVHTTANILALATDFSLNNDKVYAFDVPSYKTPLATFTPKIVDGNNTVIAFNETKQNIMYDGVNIYATLPKNFGHTNFVTLHQKGVDGQVADVTGRLSVDTTKNAFVGRMVQDTASGMMVVPGDWGVRVNE